MSNSPNPPDLNPSDRFSRETFAAQIIFTCMAALEDSGLPPDCVFVFRTESNSRRIEGPEIELTSGAIAKYNLPEDFISQGPEDKMGAYIHLHDCVPTYCFLGGTA